jgi:hypothetical protein
VVAACPAPSSFGSGFRREAAQNAGSAVGDTPIAWRSVLVHASRRARHSRRSVVADRKVVGVEDVGWSALDDGDRTSGGVVRRCKATVGDRINRW